MLLRRMLGDDQIYSKLLKAHHNVGMVLTKRLNMPSSMTKAMRGGKIMVELAGAIRNITRKTAFQH